MTARKRHVDAPSVGEPARHRGHKYVVAAVGRDKSLGIDVVTFGRAKGSRKGDGTLKEVTGALADIGVTEEGEWCFKGCQGPRADGRRGIGEFDLPGAKKPAAKQSRKRGR